MKKRYLILVGILIFGIFAAPTRAAEPEVIEGTLEDWHYYRVSFRGDSDTKFYFYFEISVLTIIYVIACDSEQYADFYNLYVSLYYLLGIWYDYDSEGWWYWDIPYKDTWYILFLNDGVTTYIHIEYYIENPYREPNSPLPIILGVVFGILGVGAITGLGFYYYKKKKSKREVIMDKLGTKRDVSKVVIVDKLRPKIRFCSECGSELHGKFCSICGTKAYYNEIT